LIDESDHYGWNIHIYYITREREREMITQILAATRKREKRKKKRKSVCVYIIQRKEKTIRT